MTKKLKRIKISTLNVEISKYAQADGPSARIWKAIDSMENPQRLLMAEAACKATYKRRKDKKTPINKLLFYYYNRACERLLRKGVVVPKLPKSLAEVSK